MKDPRLKGERRVAFLDGASRRVTGAFPFPEATSGNAAPALRVAIRSWGALATTLGRRQQLRVGPSRRAQGQMEAHRI